MNFENQGGQFMLTGKMENSPIIGIADTSGASDGGLLASEIRFKFPGDEKVRT
jgi:hypothetical protein